MTPTPIPVTRQFVSLGTLAICLAYSIALIPGNTSPLIVGGLIAGLGLGVADSGMVLSLELILMGLAATCLAPAMSNLDARKTCLAGALLLLLGHGLAMLAGNLTELLLFRCLAGIGAGTVLAAVNATIAAASNPPRLYGLTMMVPPLLGAIVAFLMSRAISLFAHSGAYGVLALLTLLVIPFLLAFPDYRKRVVRAIPEKLADYGSGIALLLVILLTGASMMAYFAFVERLGVRLGLDIKEIGNIFTWVVLGGALGAGIAAALEDRFGLVKPLLAGIVLHSSAMILAIQVELMPAYVTGAILEGITLVYTLTFLFAIAARFDPIGRWAAAAGGAFSLSLGIGPYVGGAIIETAGFDALSALILLSTLVIFTLLWWIARDTRLSSSSG